MLDAFFIEREIFDKYLLITVMQDVWQVFKSWTFQIEPLHLHDMIVSYIKLCRL